MICYIIVSAVWVPEIVNIDDFKISEERQNEIIAAEKGSYNDVLPIFAGKIEILEADEERILYKTGYFPFGTTITEYAKDTNEWIFSLQKRIKD